MANKLDTVIIGQRDSLSIKRSQLLADLRDRLYSAPTAFTLAGS